jgi:hypothetical protein
VRMRKASRKSGVSALERAFQLARSGSVRDIGEPKKALDPEGYSSREIEGSVIRGQLRGLVKAARGAVSAEPRSI